MNSSLAQLDKNLDLYLVKKAPALPKGAKDAIVQFGPWIVLILLVMTLPLILMAFGIGAFVAPFAFVANPGNGLLYVVAMAILAASIVLEVLALPGLFKRQRKAWEYMFYATLLGAVSSLLQGSIFGMVIGTLIGLYILYQIKEYYK